MEFLFFGRHTQYTQLSNTSDVKDKLNIKILTKNLAIIWIYIVLQLVSKQCLAIELQRTSEYHPDVCPHFYTRFLAKKNGRICLYLERGLKMTYLHALPVRFNTYYLLIHTLTHTLTCNQ